MTNDTLPVSIVMPTYNRLPVLQRVIAALEQQTGLNEGFELIVVSDGATDGTNEYLAQYHNGLCLRPIYQQNAGPAGARNRGVQEARGEIVLFLDDDVVPAPHLVRQHLLAHRQHPDERVVVIGPMLAPPDFPLSPWSQWMQDRLAEQYHSMTAGEWAPTARQFYTGNASLARRLFLEHGGFDPTLQRAEDVELAYRMAGSGVRFLFCPQAEGFHYEQRTFSSWLNIAYSYGRNDVHFYRHKSQEWLGPVMYREYEARHPITRFAVWACLDRKRLVTLVTRLGKQLALLGQRIHQELLVRLGCSTLFNLHYYQGVADELGGRAQFFAGRRR